MRIFNQLILLAVGVLPLSVAQADIDHNDDVLVNSVCADSGFGFCNPDEVFSVFFDVNTSYTPQYKAKGYAPIIYFEDMEDGFADWALGSGGNMGVGPTESFTVFNDETNTTPLIIENGIRDNQLYLDSSGNVGINVVNPSADLHVGGSGRLLLDGFGEWKLEPGIFGLGFGRPSYPLYDMVISDFGNIGMGTIYPTEAVDVEKSAAAARFQLTSYTNTASEAPQYIQRRARGGGLRPVPWGHLTTSACSVSGGTTAPR